MENWRESTPKIKLYSDGGAEPNPGRGGFGLILSWGNVRKEFSEGYFMTTNNRMELLGVIIGLEKLKTESEVTVYTDSKYVINGIEKGWAKRWQENNWKRNKKEKAVNPDLWEKLLKQVEKHKVTFCWIKGHNGHSENERCDELATLALKSNNLKEDKGYTLDEEIRNEIAEKKNNNKPRVQKEGDLCRKCDIPVIKRFPPKTKIKEGQKYYYEYYLYCSQCQSMYMVEDGKRLVEENKKKTLFD